jgi:hypothetical protein
MGAWNDFSNWADSEAAAIGKGISNFATGVADTAKYGLDCVVGAPVTIVKEIKDGIVEVSKVGGDAFKAGAHEGAVAFGSAASAYKDVVHEASLAVQGIGKAAGGAIGSVGSSLAWPLGIAAALVGVAFVMKR